MPVAAFGRLGRALAGNEGEVRYRLDFGRDELGTDYVHVHAQAPLTMVCQRTLEPFVLPVTVDSRLGLIRQERDEAGLPSGCEPLLVPEDGRLHPADVVEDELLLALPLVPVNPDGCLPDALLDRGEPEQDEAQAHENNPFAVLRELKK